MKPLTRLAIAKKWRDIGYTIGYRQAIEDAAKAVENRKGRPEHHSDLAQIIRALLTAEASR